MTSAISCHTDWRVVAVTIFSSCCRLPRISAIATSCESTFSFNAINSGDPILCMTLLQCGQLKWPDPHLKTTQYYSFREVLSSLLFQKARDFLQVIHKAAILQLARLTVGSAQDR